MLFDKWNWNLAHLEEVIWVSEVKAYIEKMNYLLCMKHKLILR